MASVIRQLTGRGEHRFVELLIAQIDTTAEAARFVRSLSEGIDPGVTSPDRLHDLERQGDQYGGEMVEALSGALVTPIDREDVFRVSRCIDDILDNLRDFGVEWELQRVEPSRTFIPLLDAIIDGMGHLRSTLPDLGIDPSSITEGAVRTKTQGNQVRRLFQTAVAELFDAAEIHIDILKIRELLRRLDVVGLRMREAADALSDASIKRSH